MATQEDRDRELQEGQVVIQVHVDGPRGSYITKPVDASKLANAVKKAALEHRNDVLVVGVSGVGKNEYIEKLTKQIDASTERLKDESHEALSQPDAEDYELFEKASVAQAKAVLSQFEAFEGELKEFESSYADTSKQFNEQIDALDEERKKLMKQLSGEF